MSSAQSRSTRGFAQVLVFIVMVAGLFSASACKKASETADQGSGGHEPGYEAPDASIPEPPFCRSDACFGSTCVKTLTVAQSKVPADACPDHGESQTDVDIFAWNTFLALNWPADLATCGPNLHASILDGTGPVVWETYARDTSIFVDPKTEKPAPWCGTGLQALLSEPRGFSHLSKASTSSTNGFPFIEEAVGGVLTDQNGRFVRYEKLVNLDEYNYILYNDLWNKAGQKGKTISFPWGPTEQPSPCGDKPCGPVGAMEVKAAWKVLSADEIAGNNFYMTEGTVFNDDQGDPSPGANPVTLGLVGLHIIHKTQTQQNWFWSTFEQVDNTKSSFFDPGCTDCKDNSQTASKPYTELCAQETCAGGKTYGEPLNDPVQVTRVTPITPENDDLNAYYQSLLGDSVWANYELISTNWTTGGAPDGTPPILANTTLETYVQTGKIASCFKCHSFVKDTYDFSFLLGEAQ